MSKAFPVIYYIFIYIFPIIVLYSTCIHVKCIIYIIRP